MNGLASGRRRDWSRWHALIEQYTPDGWLGRLLLGVVCTSVCVPLLFLALFGLTSFSLFPLLGGLLSLAGGVATGILAVVTLWPVYLSLIGNIDAAAEYASDDASTRPGPVTADVAVSDDPVAIAKRQYAAGELSHEEFERRLDRLMDDDERVRADAESDSSERARVVESER